MKLPEDRKKFIGLIEQGATVTKACQLLKLHRSTFYDWRDNDAEFARAYIEAKAICHDETNDAASFHYHKLVRSGDKRFVKKWLDQQHPEFVQKPLRVLVHKVGDHDSGLMSMDQDELFQLIRAYQNNGFEAVDTLDEKTQKEYAKWHENNYPGGHDSIDKDPRWNAISKIVDNTLKKRSKEE